MDISSQKTLLSNFTKVKINTITFKIKSDYITYPSIELFEFLGIHIPKFCYSSELSVAGNCRMCIVELRNSTKPFLLCMHNSKSFTGKTTEFFTSSFFTKKARENILDFLLANHPLDCPVCDQAGECDLQDQSVLYGSYKKKFYGLKRIVSDFYLGVVIKTVMTRCIHCTKCVRFFNEISNTNDLCMLGRGSKSEINTFVDQLLYTELSGNVVDLCPVGALTYKEYSFIKKDWEMTNIVFFDTLERLKQKLIIQTYDNKIYKVIPPKNKKSDSYRNWITDRARFSFDGMFSSERLIENFLITGKYKMHYPFLWKKVFLQLLQIFYFHDHTKKHFKDTGSLCVIFDTNTSLENINFLLILKIKHKFLKLKKLKKFNWFNDQETDFLINDSVSTTKILFSDFCLLIGVNSRYECSVLNLILKKRKTKKKFEVISFSSLINLTFFTSYVGLNKKTLFNLFEGNNIFCQKFCNSSNPLVILGSEIVKANDSLSIFKGLFELKKVSKVFYNTWNRLNLLNELINESGINYINNFQEFHRLDFYGIMFFDANDKNPLLKKIIFLKLLGYFSLNLRTNFSFFKNEKLKFVLDQNTTHLTNPYLKSIHTWLAFCVNYIHLSNTNFYEETNSFLSGEKLLKKNTKFISPQKQLKENWKIMRRIKNIISKISFLNFTNNKIIVNYKRLKSFFYYYISLQFASKLLFELTQDEIINKRLYKIKKIKIFFNFVKMWLNDFFSVKNDSVNDLSKNMKKLSTWSRIISNNFGNKIVFINK